MALGKILVLFVGFTLPRSNEECTQDFLDMFANLDLSLITDELGGCPSLDDVIHEGAGEVSRSLHPISVQ